jgi:hypothetical protein
VLVFIDGANEVVPVPPLTIEPLLNAVYQSIVQLAGGVALKVTVPLPQRALPLAPVGAAGTAFTVPDTANREVDTQPVVLCRACA